MTHRRLFNAMTSLLMEYWEKRPSDELASLLSTLCMAAYESPVGAATTDDWATFMATEGLLVRDLPSDRGGGGLASVVRFLATQSWCRIDDVLHELELVVHNGHGEVLRRSDWERCCEKGTPPYP